MIENWKPSDPLRAANCLLAMTALKAVILALNLSSFMSPAYVLASALNFALWCVILVAIARGLRAGRYWGALAAGLAAFSLLGSLCFPLSLAVLWNLAPAEAQAWLRAEWAALRSGQSRG